MTVVHLGNDLFMGLSTDTKPTGNPAGARFFETDLSKIWWYDGFKWRQQTGMLPSSGRKTGIFFPSGNGSLGGQLMFCSGMSTTGASVTGIDTATTNGYYQNSPTTATLGNACGLRWIGVQATLLKLNMTFKIKMSVDTNTNNRFFIGFRSSNGDWVVGDEPAANVHAMFIGARSTDTVWVIGTNANSATSTYVNYNKDGVGGTLALDTNIHSVEITTASGSVSFQVDNNSVHTISSPVPGATQNLYGPVWDIQTNENVIHNMRVYWAEMGLDTI
jgi:hypothetical protein